MRLHLFRPAAAERYSGILLYCCTRESYQIAGPIRRIAAFLAGLGYLVAAPEVYHEFEKPGAVLAYDAAGTDRGNELKSTTELSAFDSGSLGDQSPELLFGAIESLLTPRWREPDANFWSPFATSQPNVRTG
jgi:dienelactone hydrolase